MLPDPSLRSYLRLARLMGLGHRIMGVVAVEVLGVETFTMVITTMAHSRDNTSIWQTPNTSLSIHHRRMLWIPRRLLHSQLANIQFLFPTPIAISTILNPAPEHTQTPKHPHPSSHRLHPFSIPLLHPPPIHSSPHIHLLPTGARAEAIEAFFSRRKGNFQGGDGGD